MISDLDRAVSDLGDFYAWTKTMQSEIDAIAGILDSKTSS
jgi:hypothetical protein